LEDGLEYLTELVDSCHIGSSQYEEQSYPTPQCKESPNLEKETDEVKAPISEFDSEINRRFKEEEDLTYDGAKINPEDWSEYLQYDPDFLEEFDNIVSDPGIPEADKDFTPQMCSAAHT
jgi:hypothetical protein